jgi:hypothetical protein
MEFLVHIPIKTAFQTSQVEIRMGYIQNGPYATSQQYEEEEDGKTVAVRPSLIVLGA